MWTSATRWLGDESGIGDDIEGEEETIYVEEEQWEGQKESERMMSLSLRFSLLLSLAELTVT